MSAPIDVRGILERAGADPGAPEGSQAWALAQVDAVVAKLIEAARTYFNGYCVDEAEDDFEDSVFGLNTGCTPEQHEDAKRLRDALARIGGAA